MKRKIIYFIGLLFISMYSMSQDNSYSSIPLIGDPAPAFTAESTNGDIVFPADYTLQWKIIFSHPADFTPVCTSEIVELANDQPEFDKLHTKILVVSTDPVDIHRTWIKSMEELKYKNIDTKKIKFPLIADQNHSVSKKYGMIRQTNNTTRDVRGVFIIDPSDKVRAVFFYPMNVGRNIDEIKRTLVALQTADKEHVMTPANWEPGGDVLVPYVKSKDDAKEFAENNPELYQVAWYMWLKKGSK
jgi:peroxiredoxin 2/4